MSKRKDKVEETTTPFVVSLDNDLLDALHPILRDRGLTVPMVVSLYLRTLVNGHRKSCPVKLHEPLPIGKFKGETLETVIRAEPGYVAWLTGNVESFRLDPDAMRLLSALVEDVR